MTGFTAQNYMSGQAAGISETVLGQPSWPNRPKPVPLWQRNQLSFFVTLGAEPHAVELTNPDLTAARQIRERNDPDAVSGRKYLTDWALNPAREERQESAEIVTESDRRDFKAVGTEQSFPGETVPVKTEPKSPAEAVVTDPNSVAGFKERQDLWFRGLSLLALKRRPIQASEFMILSGSHALARMVGKNGFKNPHAVGTRNRPAAIGAHFDDDPPPGVREEIAGFTVPFSFQASSAYRPETWFPVPARIGLYRAERPKPFGERCDYFM